jgi:hypothetical protein
MVATFVSWRLSPVDRRQAAVLAYDYSEARR